ENRVLRRIFGPKRDEVKGDWRKLHNEELHNLYSSSSVIRMIKSRRMRWEVMWLDWKVRQLIPCDRRMTITELEHEVGTVTGHFYVQRLRNAVRRMRRDKWQGQRFLHHDNAPSHTLLVVQQFLAEKNIPVITQPPYSPDLTPSDFWLFPTLKMGIKGTHFPTMEDIKSS
ncbi:hypothetical protein B7P43_G16624, partial [Cryptotermes secundus]